MEKEMRRELTIWRKQGWCTKRRLAAVQTLGDLGNASLLLLTLVGYECDLKV